jgi:hypothetical protein
MKRVFAGRGGKGADASRAADPRGKQVANGGLRPQPPKVRGDIVLVVHTYYFLSTKGPVILRATCRVSIWSIVRHRERKRLGWSVRERSKIKSPSETRRSSLVEVPGSEFLGCGVSWVLSLIEAFAYKYLRCCSLLQGPRAAAAVGEACAGRGDAGPAGGDGLRAVACHPLPDVPALQPRPTGDGMTVAKTMELLFKMMLMVMMVIMVMMMMVVMMMMMMMMMMMACAWACGAVPVERVRLRVEQPAGVRQPVGAAVDGSAAGRLVPATRAIPTGNLRR